MAYLITRRSFMKAGVQAGLGLGLASLVNVPPFLKRALAEGQIGVNGKKLIFIFLRGGNDGVNNVIPILDPSYRGTQDTGTGEYANRNLIGLPKHPLGDAYYQGTGGYATCPGLDPDNPGAAIPLCNGFAALNPALADLVPLYRTGKLALLQRVGYRSLSRSHFDSEKYWEKGSDGTSAHRLITDGLWYRTIAESGWNQNHALSAVSVQDNMPQSLRGAQPMANLSSIDRYNLLGVYNPQSVMVASNKFVTWNSDRTKITNALDVANAQAYPAKDSRELVYNLSRAFQKTLATFQDDDFLSNEFYDSDGTTKLFPAVAADDPAGRMGGSFGFIQKIKSCAQILNNTDAVITGTEVGGWDTHTSQVTAGSPHLGDHSKLLKRVAWAYYALWRYFALYGRQPGDPPSSNKVGWNDVIVVTMSEFGRTSAENDSRGTDHAEASVMYVAGGGVHGGTYGCDTQPNPILGGPNWAIGDGGKNGALYEAERVVGYLRRTIDYRSVLGEIIRDHLGATQGQLDRIIPAYANESVEHLKSGGPVGTTSITRILGELGIV